MTASFRGVWAAFLLVFPLGAGAEEASTDAPPPAVSTSVSPVGEVRPGEVPVPMAEAIRSIRFFGYLKVDYEQFLPPNEDAVVGSRSGFRLLNARLGVAIEPTESLEVIASIEGSAPQRDVTNALEGTRVVALRDAYAQWQAKPYLGLRVGQFKPPFNAETLLSDGLLPFVTRSIVSEGVLPPESTVRQGGIALERQLGVQAASERLGQGLVGFRYAVAVVNGNGQNKIVNDNSAVTPVGRVTLELGDYLVVGLNAFYDEATLGVSPSLRLNETRIGYGGDVTLALGGFTFLGMALMQNTDFTGSGLEGSMAQGFMASAHYLSQQLGVEGGLRFALLEPSDLQEEDEITELTAMAGYRMPKLPVRLLVQYTYRGEEVEVQNNSLHLFAQVSF